MERLNLDDITVEDTRDVNWPAWSETSRSNLSRMPTPTPRS
jgi:hypothetical protein